MAYEDIVLGDSPVAYWRLDETSGTTASDEVGTRHGTHVNTPTLNQAAAIVDGGASVTYARTNEERTEVADSDVFSPSDLSYIFSLEAWVKLTGDKATRYQIVTKGDGGDYEFGLWWQESGGLRFALYTLIGGDAGFAHIDQADVSFDEWHHVVATGDGSNVRLYLDGVLMDTGSILGGGGNSTAPFIMGGRNDLSNYLEGSLDEVAWYDTTLSATQVGEHYDSGAGVAPPDGEVAAPAISSSAAIEEPTLEVDGLYSELILSDGPIAYFRLGETSGDAIDETGNGHDATYMNFDGSERGVPGALILGDDGAAEFDGTDNIIAIVQASAQLDNDLRATGSLTFEVWARPTHARDAFLISGGSSPQAASGQDGYHVGLTDDGRLTVFLQGVSADIDVAFGDPGAVALNAWSHLAVSYDGSTLRAYVNGVEVGSLAQAITLDWGEESFVLGRVSTQSTLYFRGVLDEAAVYDVALSEAQIQEHYEKGSGISRYLDMPAIEADAQVLTAIAAQVVIKPEPFIADILYWGPDPYTESVVDAPTVMAEAERLEPEAAGRPPIRPDAVTAEAELPEPTVAAVNNVDAPEIQASVQILNAEVQLPGFGVVAPIVEAEAEVPTPFLDTQFSSRWQYVNVPWSEVSALVQDLSPGVGYEFQIAAVDRFGNSSDFSASTQVTASADDIPPSTPAAPNAVGAILSIIAEHFLGKASGGEFNLEMDLDHVEFHASQTSGFTPTQETKRSSVEASASSLRAETPLVTSFSVPQDGTWYVKVVAVDASGNESEPSEQDAVNVRKVGEEDLQELIVGTAIIKDLAVTNAKIADLAVSNAKIQSLSAGKITAGNIQSGGYIRSTLFSPGSSGWSVNADGSAEFNEVTVRGTIYATDGTFSGALQAATGTFSGSLQAASGTFTGNLSAAGGTFRGTLQGVDGTFEGSLSAGVSISSPSISGGTMTGSTFRTGSSGERIVISSPDDISYYDSLNRLRGKIHWWGGAFRIDALAGTAATLTLAGDNIVMGTVNDNIVIEGYWLNFSNQYPASLRTGQGAGSGIEIQSRPYSSTSAYRGFAAAFFRNASSREYKHDIHDVQDEALGTLRQLRVRQYKLNEDDRDERRNLHRDSATSAIPGRKMPVRATTQQRERRGLIAEELPEALRLDDGYDIGEVLALCIQGIQELTLQVDDLRGGGTPNNPRRA